jgi:hypothetical protein
VRRPDFSLPSFKVVIHDTGKFFFCNSPRPIEDDLGRSTANKNRLFKAREMELLVDNLGPKMQKKMFRCGESNPDLLGESEKS